MFKQPLVSTEIIDSKPCLDLLEQKRQANVAELFGNETFKNAMTSQGKEAYTTNITLLHFIFMKD